MKLKNCHSGDFTAKLSPVQRMVGGLLSGFSRAGSTFGRKGKGDFAHQERFDANIEINYDEYKVLRRYVYINHVK